MRQGIESIIKTTTRVYGLEQQGGKKNEEITFNKIHPWRPAMASDSNTKLDNVKINVKHTALNQQ